MPDLLGARPTPPAVLGREGLAALLELEVELIAPLLIRLQPCVVAETGWVVERSNSWLNRNRGLLVRWSKKPENRRAPHHENGHLH